MRFYLASRSILFVQLRPPIEVLEEFNLASHRGSEIQAKCLESATIRGSSSRHKENIYEGEMKKRTLGKDT